MLDFSFTEEQIMTQKTMRDFSEKELLPRYQQHDKTEIFPSDLWEKMSELGLMGLRIPEEYGGNPVDYVTLGLIIKELSRGDPNCAQFTVLPILSEIVFNHASKEVKDEWLPLLASGKKKIALGVSEPHCGSDVSAMKAKAVKKGDYYYLNGEKSGISFMMNCDALILYAITDPDAKTGGISSFFVPMNLPGVNRSSYKDMGEKLIMRGSVFLDDVKISEKYRLGEEGKGFYQAMSTFDVLRLCLCMVALGAAEKSIEETIEYVKIREAFGKPLAKFEGVSFPLVEHYTKLMSAHWLCFQALWAHNKGLKHTKETAMCKYYTPQIAVQAIHECLLLHGHYGYTKDFPMEQRLRDIIALEFADGTAQIQKIIVTRELMGKEYLPY